MATLAGDAHRRATARLVEHLRVTCPAQTAGLSAEQLRREVEAGVVHAGRYGIEAEGDLMVFIECRAQLGADFDTREPWAAAVLGDESLFPEEKASFLADRHMLALMAEDAP